MRKLTITLLSFCSVFLAFGQSDHQQLISLGKAYKNFMFRNDPTKEDLKGLKSSVPGHLKASSDFIVQTISKGNKLLAPQYLSRPNDETLKQLYIIRAVNLNLREESQVANDRLIDSLKEAQVPVYELLDNYYEMLFTAVGNKNQPFNLAKTDIKIRDYHLKDETEQGILFLKAMRFCGITIWGYMNVVNPPNTQKAYAYIKMFPKFNGRPYYQFTDLYFADFEMNVIKDKGVQSYKSYYLDKYYETLLSHLICLNKQGAGEKEKNDLLLGSILKDRNLYKYTKYKDTLESIFKEQPQN